MGRRCGSSASPETGRPRSAMPIRAKLNNSSMACGDACQERDHVQPCFFARPHRACRISSSACSPTRAGRRCRRRVRVAYRAASQGRHSAHYGYYPEGHPRFPGGRSAVAAATRGGARVHPKRWRRGDQQPFHARRPQRADAGADRRRAGGRRRFRDDGDPAHHARRGRAGRNSARQRVEPVRLRRDRRRGRGIHPAGQRHARSERRSERRLARDLEITRRLRRADGRYPFQCLGLALRYPRFLSDRYAGCAARQPGSRRL